MTRIIAFANQKGGVAKTTTAHNVGVALARMGRKVLLVDLDSQASLTRSFGLDPFELEKKSVPTVFDVLEQEEEGTLPMREAILQQGQVDLVPSHLKVSEADLLFGGRFGREGILKRCLEGLSDYEYILLDCPPYLGLVTVNALAAATEMVIPLQAEFHAMNGINLIVGRTFNKIRKTINPRLKITGIVLTLYDDRKRLCRDVREELKEHLGAMCMDTVIRDNVSLAEAPSHGQDIFAYKPRSTGAEDYDALAREIEGRA